MNDPGLGEVIFNSEDAVRRQLSEDEAFDQNSNSKATRRPTNTSLSAEAKETTAMALTTGEGGERRRKAERFGSHFAKSLHTKKDTNLDASSVYQPTLWWMTGTAFPLFAGSFGPIANLLSVCALVDSWRIRIEDEMRIRDPHWLTGLNATSLLLALIANIVLMFNFARRIQYRIAQPITIALWYISCILLLTCLGLVHTIGMPDNNSGTKAYTQSYYYGLISSILYFVIASMLLLSSLGSMVFHAYPPSFTSLTVPQRTLMLQTTSFSLYLAFGAGMFAIMEGWQFVDGIYWADYTLLTIGLGSDFPLQTALARMLLIPYAAFGITLVGLVVSSVRGLVLERAKAKVVRRHLGKEREKWRKNIEARIRMASIPPTSENISQELDKVSTKNETIVNCLQRWKERRLSRLPQDFVKHCSVPLKPEDQQGAWRRAEFELMRFIEMHSEQTKRYLSLIMSFLVILVVWVGGSLIFWSCEHHSQGWTYTNAFYFSYTTLLTIGYGDFYPSSSAGKPFFVIWSLISVPAMTVLISNMGDTVVAWVKDVTVLISKWTILPEKNETPETASLTDHLEKEQGKLERKVGGRNNSLNQVPDIEAHGHGVSSSDVSRNGSRAPSQRTESSHSSQDSASSESRASVVLQEGVRNFGDEVQDFEVSEGRDESLAARISREISKLSKDIRKKPPKRYSWEEWSRWLELLGERDDFGQKSVISLLNTVDGQELPILPQDSNAATCVQDDVNDDRSHHDTNAQPFNSSESEKGSIHHLKTSHPSRSRGSSPQKEEPSTDNKPHSGWSWTWLGDHGPLFSSLTETEWIIEKLCLRLEQVLEDEIREARAYTSNRSESSRRR